MLDLRAIKFAQCYPVAPSSGIRKGGTEDFGFPYQPMSVSYLNELKMKQNGWPKLVQPAIQSKESDK